MALVVLDLKNLCYEIYRTVVTVNYAYFCYVHYHLDAMKGMA